ncbi:MAG: RNA polymerase sigma factor, partial [Gemmataceae bacterium]
MPATPQHLLDVIRAAVPWAGEDSEAALLARFAGRADEDAFTALVARHGAMVVGVCRRVLGDAHEAEDVAQATFLVLAREAGNLRRPDALPAWLHHTARHLALKHRRGRDRRIRREGRAARPEAVTGPADELTVRELMAALDEE